MPLICPRLAPASYHCSNDVPWLHLVVADGLMGQEFSQELMPQHDPALRLSHMQCLKPWLTISTQHAGLGLMHCKGLY